MPTSLFIFKSFSTNLSFLFILFYNSLTTVLTTFFETLPEGTWEPEQGVQPEEREGAHQQTGHYPERIKQVRIFITVMMGCMSQITSKFSVGSRMAWPAGFNHIAPIQTRLAIIGRQDIVRPVTIGTFCSFLTTGQKRCLAMIGIKITFCFMFVTGSTFLENKGSKISSVNTLNSVRSMTILA